MSEVKIKELDKSLIHQANSNSMSGQRGDISAHEYEVYCQKVMSWNIPDGRKQKIVDQIYAKWSEQLRHEAAHVSVAVAGPARYNAKKLDHSDAILRLSSEFVEWFNGLQEQIWQGRIEDKDAKEIARLVDDIKFCIERPTLNPTASLCELANKDPELFMEYYEKLHEKYRWRKNSVIAKLYAAGKEGKLARLNRQKFFEDESLVAYTMGDRAYIKFVMKPRQQLIVALKSRKWWWNSNEEAWSTYLNKLDKESAAYISSIDAFYYSGKYTLTVRTVSSGGLYLPIVAEQTAQAVFDKAAELGITLSEYKVEEFSEGNSSKVENLILWKSADGVTGTYTDDTGSSPYIETDVTIERLAEIVR